MYSDYIQINKNFQTSVNLELDLNSESKIEEYIPTRDICDVLKRYMNSFLGAKGDKATTLVGPYGKGKSFLLLVLSYLVSQNPTTKTYRNLLKKIKKVDSELYNSIKAFNGSGKNLLPVIINSNYDNLNQAFLLALNDSLKRENISNIVPKTTYSVCLDLIREWRNDDEVNRRILVRCEKEIGTTLDKLEAGLRNYSATSYEQFVTLYNCFTHGMPFNPLINNDIVHVYSEVNHELASRGFSGMFIIFDEFSKFLESVGDSVSKDLKIIQDFAEAAARSSSDEQMHICCVTHKSFSLYRSSDKADSFKTVEGRFKEVKFNRTLDENYQIISAAINNENAQTMISKYIENFKPFYTQVSSFAPFERNIDLKDLYYGCFPLNPITVYSLIQLSELVAQNERTLFTFICDTDNNSLNSFLHTNNRGLFNVDKIYDYFSPLLKKEEGNSIRNIWYRTEGTLSKIDDPEKRSIIKSLAVILMINDPEMFPPDETTISLATMLPKKTVTSKITDLIEEHFVRKNIINNLLSFASSNNKEIEDQISIVSQTKEGSVLFNRVLDDINETKYLLPRRYNEQNKITRFYRSSFITEEQLKALSSFGPLKEKEFSDALVLSLIRVSMTDKEIRNSFSAKADPKVILRYPCKPVSQILFKELIRYDSLQDIINKGGNDEIVSSELELLRLEAADDIRELIHSDFDLDYKYVSSLVASGHSFNDLLSEQMESIYTKKIVFNNELINKNVVTTVYQKSANSVINDLLNGRETEYSDTSPETTIKKSVCKKIDSQNDVLDIIAEIKEMIIHSEEKRLPVSKITNKYCEAPYGLRKGILPILLARSISEMSSNVLLYLKNKEIDLDATNLVKAVNTYGDYSFRSSKGALEQSDYLNDMLACFDKKATGNSRVDTKNLCEEFRRFFVGLPMVIRGTEIENPLNISKEIIKYKNNFLSFSLNPYEVVFEKPISAFECSNYNTIAEHLKSFIKDWNGYLSNYKMSIADSMKASLDIAKNDSLHMALNALLHSLIGDSKPMLNDMNASLMSALLELSYNDEEAINELSHTALGVYIEDWSGDRSDELIEHMRSFFNDVSESNKIDTAASSIDSLINNANIADLSPMGTLFQNNMQTVIDEFGESVSTEEKIAILTEMLKKYL